VKKYILVIILLFQLVNGVLAQSRSPFDSLVSELEKNNPNVFYYDKKQTNEIKIFNATGSLDEVLIKIFEGTDFVFVKDSQGRIFITKGFSFNSKLPSDFFVKRTGREKVDTTSNDLYGNTVVAKMENIVYVIGIKGGSSSSAVISGYVRDATSGEPLSSATVAVEGGKVVSTDGFGFYSITVPKGRHILKISSVGMKELIRQVNVQGNGKLEMEMREEVRSLKTIVVAQKQSNVRGMQMGVERLSIKTIKQIPAIFGETDLMRSLLTLPGVTSVGEGTAGYNVRGGATDQNLILLNDMTLFNPTHLFGFFSAVDPEIVRGLELYKSAIPEKFGGRISSIMDVTTRDGNSKKITGTAGLGPLTSKFTLEGPLGSEKTTFLLGGRVTYSNWLLKQIPDPTFKNSKASFYDFMMHFSHTFSDKDRIFLSGYASSDRFKLTADSTYAYINRNINIKWKHTFTNKLYAVLSNVLNQYNYTVEGRSNPLDAFDIGFGVKQIGTKADFKYAPDNKHDINFGIQHLLYDLKPGEINPLNKSSIIKPLKLENEKATETSIYLGDQYSVNEKLSVQAGLRYSYYRYLGAQEIYQYVQGQPRNETTVIGSTQYKNGQLIKPYQGPEYRLSARYLLSSKSSIKFSYNTLRQYIHMITNTTAISPTDIWKLSDPYVKPQIGEQFSAGFYTQPGNKGIELSVEAYFKRSKNYLDYKSGAKLILNEAIERDVLSTKGKAYGVEFLVKKPTGKLNGWLSYTYSRTFLKVDDPDAGETINKGDYYPANFDKPNVVSLVSNYRFSQRFSISMTSTYSTGRPITMPIGTFNLGGSPRVYYSERNAYRIPDFFRTDLSMTLEGNHKLKQKVHNSWTFGIYNITGRDNPYSVYFTLEDGTIKGYQLSVFATAIPFLSFNLRF
jgi:hypothetical protein